MNKKEDWSTKYGHWIPLIGILIFVIILLSYVSKVEAVDIWMDVDAAVTVPVNIYPLTDSDGVIDAGVTYNEAGLDMVWNFVLPDGTQTQTAFDPCDTAGNYDWTIIGNGMYKIEIPDTGGEDMDNDTEGFGWVSGTCTATLPFRGPIIGFRSSLTNDSLIEGLLLNVQDIADGIDAGSADVNTLITFAATLDTQSEIRTLWYGSDTPGATAAGQTTIAGYTDDIGVAGVGLTSVGLATNAMDADALNADAITEIWAKAMVDIGAGAPSATASVLTAINYLYEAWRNKTVTTGAGEVQLYMDNASTILTETDVSDDGTNFTKGEYGAAD